MKVLRGYQAAREAFLQRKPLEETDVPESVRKGLQAIFGVEISPRDAVDRIIADVRARGDAALLDYTQRIDRVTLSRIQVSQEEIDEAYKTTPQKLRQALETAATRIREFHELHKTTTWVDFSRGLGQIVWPLDRVGLYAPGGRAIYPSTVLMTAVPAKVAGVPEIFLATPPNREGNAASVLLAAAKVAGVDRVFKLGGAQAIAALAYGTESVPKVDKICGPGNLFVVLAKRAVFGAVGIDGLHGPSEAVVLADESADAHLCAADMLAQAEHDELASAVLITTSQQLLSQVQADIQRQLGELERAETIRGALDRNGFLVLVDDLAQGAELVNLYGPEHLSVMIRDPWSIIGSIRHTGAIFLGANSSAALGDYVAGPSHVMPTGNTVRFSSPLRVEDFIKVTSLVALDAASSRAVAGAGVTIAEAEGLTAHARAIQAHADRKPSA